MFQAKTYNEHSRQLISSRGLFCVLLASSCLSPAAKIRVGLSLVQLNLSLVHGLITMPSAAVRSVAKAESKKVRGRAHGRRDCTDARESTTVKEVKTNVKHKMEREKALSLSRTHIKNLRTIKLQLECSYVLLDYYFPTETISAHIVDTRVLVDTVQGEQKHAQFAVLVKQLEKSFLTAQATLRHLSVR